MVNRFCFVEEIDDSVGEQLGSAGVEHQRGGGFEDASGSATRLVIGGSLGRRPAVGLAVNGGVRRGVPATRELDQAWRVPQACVHAFSTFAMEPGRVDVAGEREPAGEDSFVLGE